MESQIVQEVVDAGPLGEVSELLTHYINTGNIPTDKRALMFLKRP